MKCIIAGCRDCTDYQHLRFALHACGFVAEITEVVSGCARGADQLGEQWAKAIGLPVTQFPAEWGVHGKSAGPIRNQEMAAYAAPGGALIALWDGKSRGTANMIDEASSHGLRIFVWDITRNAEYEAPRETT